MPRPRFFISAVAEEFSGLRQRVAELMLSLNYEVEMVDFAEGELGDSRLMLRNRIDACEGLIQIVGHAYGPEPRDVFPSFERVSYAQFEFRYARSRGKSTWLLFAGPDVERDRPAMELDFPVGSNAGDPADYQAERRRLQQQYSQTLRREEGHRYSTFNNMTELENAILKLSHGSRELHENRLGWQQAKTLAPAQPQPRSPEAVMAPIRIQKKAPEKPAKKATPKVLLAALAGVAALGGGALLLSSLHGTPRRGAAAAELRPGGDDASTAAAVATVNPDELATKRRERVDRAYEKEKEALSHEPVCDKTQNKIDDLERLHRDTLAAIERLRSGEDEHRPGMKELDEVLAEKTATESLGYVRSHWQEMLDAARSGAGSARRPAELLAACQIAIDHGDYDLAQKMMRALVDAIPEWVEAHSLCLDFALRGAGPRAEKAGLNFLARDHYRVAVAEADYLAKANAADSKAQIALNEGREAVARLEKLVSEGRSALRDMADAFKAAVETNSEKAWESFISKYGKTQVPNTDEDEGMISDAKQRLTVLRNAPTGKRPAEHNPVLEDLRDQIARISSDLKAVNKEIENDQKIYNDNLATINKLTDYKRVPVVEGSPPYRVCLQASTKIQAVEARAPGLKDKKNRVTAELSRLQARLDALNK
jgi:Mg2+ and Co2+ transporter CorA